MAYLKKYERIIDLYEGLDSMPCPSVSEVVDGYDDVVVYKSEEGVITCTANGVECKLADRMYLWIDSLEDDNVVTLKKNVSAKCWYSIDGEDFIETDSFVLNSGERAYIKAQKLTMSSSGHLNIKATKKHNVGGKALSITLWNIIEYGLASLFDGDTKLISAKDLIMPEEAKSFICSRMFQNCTSLVDAPKLPASWVHDFGYNWMFYGCTSLIIAPELPATRIGSYSYNYMFRGCSRLTVAPELPATRASQGCYNSMFYGCYALVNAPVIKTTNTYYKSHDNMFYDCYKLQSVTIEATEWDTANAVDWLSGVSSTGTFTKPASTEIPRGTSGIPEGWTIIDK